ncbi:MAG: GC-type dockerin domain-anchored protein, partial [Planctomycetota bacterium]
SQPSFTIDGTLDAAATLVASNDGLALYAGLDGDQLYVAMTAPAGNDHFLLVAQSPGALTNAMWGKAGQVAQWDAFIGAESTNGFVGWFDAASATVARGGVVEGLIDLTAEFGSAPNEVGILVAGYDTSDAGSLLAQAPAGNADGALDATEYLVIELCDLSQDGCDECPADTNGDGSLTPADFNAWVLAFNTQADECDQNGDEQCNPGDFNAWVLNFNAGC